MSDLANVNHVCRIEKSAHLFKDKDENEIIKPVIQLLPDDEKEKFLEILKSKNEKTEDFFDDFFAQFVDLEVKKVDFLET
jgi:hypothetical protein